MSLVARSLRALLLGDPATVDLGEVFDGFDGFDGFVEGPDEEIESSCLLDGLFEGFLLGGLSALGLFDFEAYEPALDDDDDVRESRAWVWSEEGFSFGRISSDDGAGIHAPTEHLVFGLEGEPVEDFLLDLGFLHCL